MFLTLMKGMNEMDIEVAEVVPLTGPKRKTWVWLGVVAVVFLLLAIIGFYLPPYLAGDYGPGIMNQIKIHNSYKCWGLTYKQYANDSPDKVFPPLTQIDNLWVPDLEALYPEYLEYQLNLTADPSIPDLYNRMENIINQKPPDLETLTRLMAESYVYPGWVVQSVSDVEVIKRLREEQHLCIGNTLKDDGVYWIHEGVERFFMAEIIETIEIDSRYKEVTARAIAQSRIPVMIARPRPETPWHPNAISWWRHYLDVHLFNTPPTIVVPTLFMDVHYENIPLNTAPEHIKALIELFPEEAEE